MVDIDYSLLNDLSDNEKELAISILNDYSKGNLNKFSELIYEDYEEIPVTIQEFLDNPIYLGKGLTDDDGKNTVFPYWRKTFDKIFPTNIDTDYNTLVLSGAIGLGKSFVAVICILYMLYRMMCLKDPYLHYGLQPIDKITFAFMNITLDASKGVAWDKCQQLLQSSKWFLERGNVSGTVNIEWTPPKGIELISGSLSRHILGRAVYACLDGDTIINTIDGDYKISELVDKPIVVPSINDCGTIINSNECTVKPTNISSIEYQLELEDGTIIKCTPEHRFMLIDGSYKEAQHLTEEDQIMDFMPFGYIYKTTNLTNGKIYIGQKHSNIFLSNKYLGSGKILKRAVSKYGKDNFKVELLEYCKSKQDLDIKEKYYIEKNDATNALIGYNIANGGQGGNLGPEVNKRISQHLRDNGWDWKTLLNKTSYIDLNGNIKYLPKNQIPPNGWVRGNTFSNKMKITNGKHGMAWDKDTPIPIGYIKGSKTHGMPKSEETRYKMLEAQKFRDYSNCVSHNKNKICITNGIHDKFISDKTDIPNGWKLGSCRKGVINSNYNLSWTLERKEKFSKSHLGENNPMFNNGQKISGGNNGHATHDYIFSGIRFDCRKNLLIYLHNLGYKVSANAIRNVMNGKNVEKYKQRFLEVFNHLTWEEKDENQIN